LSTKNTNNYRGISCLNCRHPLDISDKYCPNCGQKNTTKRLTIKDFIDEFLANFYAYDSKVKNSIVSLFTKPGIAARDFINGRRLYYANPFRFYLSISLIYFIFSGIISKFSSETNSDLESATPITKDKIFSINDSIKKNKPIIIGDSTKPLQESNQSKVFFNNTKKVKFYTEKELADKNIFKRTFSKIETYSDFLDQSKEVNPDKILDTLKHEKSNWNRYLLRKSYQINKFNEEDTSGKKGLDKFFDYLEGKIPFILFISLPFLTVVFAIVYYRKKMYYAEHMVLVFSLMSLVFLLLFLTEIINLLTNIDLSGLIFFVVTYYFYRSLRNFYQQSRLKTILKFVILSILLPITASFVALFVLFIGFLLY
jgi:hypothetical protein